jgi:cysteine synthase A
VGRTAAGRADARRGRTGSIVTLLCDSGERYLETYYNPQWVQANIGDIAPWKAQIAELVK